MTTVLLYWIWFAELKNITLLQKQQLLEQFVDPEMLYHMSEEALKKNLVPRSVQQALQEKQLDRAEAILHRCRELGIGILPLTDSAYPQRLRNTPDAPVILYYKGALPDWNMRPFVGVVGTRKATAYGLQTAHQLGGQIAFSGGCVVSGGAAGIDTAAMQGALRAGYPVVGVLGCGVDVVYPKGNRRLFEAVIEKGGCLISEYPPSSEPLYWHFPARNRIISGISNGVLIVEAPKKSGALITARYALEQGRDVFVVPGNINTPACEGSNLLLQEGAIPVLTGWDILREYAFLYPGKLKQTRSAPVSAGELPRVNVAQMPVTPEAFSTENENARKNSVDNRINSSYSVLENKELALSEDERNVLAQLTDQPQEPADLIAKLTLPAGKVLSLLTMLTIKGLAQKYPGGRVSRK